MTREANMPQTENKPICYESTGWQYLERKPNYWRKQLFIKGTKIKASTIWLDVLINNFTPEELAEDRNISIEAIKEAIKYCEKNQNLLEEEAQKERLELETNGIYVA